jgi:hypothetical protein
MTPGKLVSGVRKLAADWKFGAICVGHPDPVLHHRAVNRLISLLLSVGVD